MVAYLQFALKCMLYFLEFKEMAAHFALALKSMQQFLIFNLLAKVCYTFCAT